MEIFDLMVMNYTIDNYCKICSVLTPQVNCINCNVKNLKEKIERMLGVS